MTRFFLVGLLALATSTSLLATSIHAQDPAQILDHYRLLPRHSTLQQTGGIAGFDFKYRLIGEYDFARGPSLSSPVKFKDAEIWGSQIADHPVPAMVLDVDQILNLEGLTGHKLVVAIPGDVYQFKGNTSDGSSVSLLATVIGPWMYLRGNTQPPPGSADFFSYRVQALARSRPFADFNDDGVVNGADYVSYRDSGGAGASSITAGAGLAEWRQQFGETVPDIAKMDLMLTAALGSGGAVPEPSSCILVLGCTTVLVAGSRRSR